MAHVCRNGGTGRRIKLANTEATNYYMVKTLVKRGISEEYFVEVCQLSLTAAEACRKLDLRFTTFKRIAEKLGCYRTNQGGFGIKRPPRTKITLEDIFSNKIYVPSYRLKLRLFKVGLLKDKCSICGWAKKREGENFTTCELDHINGNHFDNRLENLRILCPNCHSLTSTYRSKNLKKKNLNIIPKIE